jgi:hypothetical protein
MITIYHLMAETEPGSYAEASRSITLTTRSTREKAEADFEVITRNKEWRMRYRRLWVQPEQIE